MIEAGKALEGVSEALDPLRKAFEHLEQAHKRLRDRAIKRAGPDLWRCDECGQHWRGHGDEGEEEHREDCPARPLAEKIF